MMKLLFLLLLVTLVYGYKKHHLPHLWDDEDNDSDGDDAKRENKLYDRNYALRQVERAEAVQAGRNPPPRLRQRYEKRGVNEKRSRSKSDDHHRKWDTSSYSLGSSSSHKTELRKEFEAEKWARVDRALAQIKGEVARPFRFRGDERDNLVEWSVSSSGDRKRSVHHNKDNDDDSDSDSDDHSAPINNDKIEPVDDINLLVPDTTAQLNLKVRAAELQARLGLDNDVQAGYFASEPQRHVAFNVDQVRKHQEVIDAAYRAAQETATAVNLPEFHAHGDKIENDGKHELVEEVNEAGQAARHAPDSLDSFATKVRLAFLFGRADHHQKLNVYSSDAQNLKLLQAIVQAANQAGKNSRGHDVFVSEAIDHFIAQAVGHLG